MGLESNSSTRPALAVFWRILAYGLLMLILAQIQLLDAASTADLKFSENTYTEWAQQLILLIICGTCILSAFRYPDWRSLTILAATMAAMGLVREYNNFFNQQVFDGAWQLSALVVLLIGGWLFFPYRKEFLSNLNRYHPSLSEGFMIAGFLTTFIFSRLFGRTLLWTTIMEDQYFRSVKNAAEESVELLGYCLLLIGAAEFVIMLRTDTTVSSHE